MFELDSNVKFPLLRLLKFLSDLKSTIYVMDILFKNILMDNKHIIFIKQNSAFIHLVFWIKQFPFLHLWISGQSDLNFLHFGN